MKIIDHVWQVGGDSLTASDDAAIYLIAFDSFAALIDAGCGWAQKARTKYFSIPATRAHA